jgi:hypothetical protein
MIPEVKTGDTRGKLGMLTQGSSRSGRRREDKAAWWMSTVGCDQRCNSKR